MFDLFHLDSLLNSMVIEIHNDSITFSRLCEIYVFCDSLIVLLNGPLSDEYYPWIDLLQDIYVSVSDQIIFHTLSSFGYTKHLVPDGYLYIADSL